MLCYVMLLFYFVIFMLLCYVMLCYDVVQPSALNKLNTGLQLKEGEISILFSALHDACNNYGIKYHGLQKYLEMVAAILRR